LTCLMSNSARTRWSLTIPRLTTEAGAAHKKEPGLYLAFLFIHTLALGLKI
jgi:hypothetical protein